MISASTKHIFISHVEQKLTFNEPNTNSFTTALHFSGLAMKSVLELHVNGIAQIIQDYSTL